MVMITSAPDLLGQIQIDYHKVRTPGRQRAQRPNILHRALAVVQHGEFAFHPIHFEGLTYQVDVCRIILNDHNRW
jgi:hypothetical protein